MNIMDHYTKNIKFVEEYNGSIDNLFKLMINQMVGILSGKILNQEFTTEIDFYGQLYIGLINISILLMHAKGYNHQYDELILKIMKTKYVNNIVKDNYQYCDELLESLIRVK